MLLAVFAGSLTGCRPEDAPADEAPAGSSGHTVVSGETNRTFELFRPKSLPEAAPLVVMLHGGFGSGTQAQQAYGWDELAEREHFVVVYPDGLDRAWAVGGGCCGNPGRTGVDDVAFIKEVVSRVKQLVPIDSTRVYATGMSNGGIFAYRLACDTKLFAAIGPVAATLLGPCPTPAPVSVLHIHGAADANVRMDGRVGEGVAKIDGPSVSEVLAIWHKANECAAPTETTTSPLTTTVAACRDGRSVKLITIAGAGHQWPGSGRKSAVPLDATRELWNFFAAYPKIA